MKKGKKAASAAPQKRRKSPSEGVSDSVRRDLLATVGTVALLAMFDSKILLGLVSIICWSGVIYYAIDK